MKITRTRRQGSIAFRFNSDAIEILAPHNMPLAEIQQLVAENRQWLEQQQQQHCNTPMAAAQQAFQAGQSAMLFGQQLPIVLQVGPLDVSHNISNDISNNTSNNSQQILVSHPQAATIQPARIQALVTAYWRYQAEQTMTPLSHKLAEKLGVSIKKISYRRTKSKWGHCTTDGELQYNWMVAQAPLDVIYYLVAHETSHLIHHDHSPAFWNCVASLCPDWKKQRRWLKEHGSWLMF